MEDPRRRGGKFESLLFDIRQCKAHNTCPELTYRCSYFEPNPETAQEWQTRGYFTEPIDRRAMFVCESPGPGAPKRKNDVEVLRGWPEWLHWCKRFHEAREKYSFENCYITNTVKCGQRTGSRHGDEEIAACRPFLLREIELIQPRVVVAVGRQAQKTLNELKQLVEKKLVVSTLDAFPEIFYISHYARSHWKRWEQQFPDLTQRVEELLRESGR